MAVSFATTTARAHQAVTVNITALSATTQYTAVFSGIDSGAARGHAMDFTTDGAGAATLTFVPQGRATAITCNIYPKTAATSAVSSNTLLVV